MWVDTATLPRETRFGEIVGWRAWTWTDTPDGPRLKSIHRGWHWESPEADGSSYECNSAQCTRANWGVGFNAFKTAATAFREGWHYPILAKVEMWGEVAEHTQGYRAECIRIVDIRPMSPWSPWLWFVCWRMKRHYLKGQKYGFGTNDPEADGGSPEEPRPDDGSPA